MRISTLSRMATVVCPVCMEEFDVEIYRVVNESDFDNFHPRIVNEVTCPHCGNRFRVGERVLFYRPEEDLIFFVYPDEEEDERFVRSVFREMKSVLRDLHIELPEIVMVIGWGRFIIMWELLKKKEIIDYFLKDYSRSNPVLFYKKLEQLAQIYQEYIEDPSQFEDEEIRDLVKKRFENIVDI